MADGRLVPVLILDTQVRREVGELVRVHQHLGPGDATTQWGISMDSGSDVALILGFARPVEVDVVLLFSVDRQAILVEAVLSAGAVILKTGKAGDRLMTTWGTPGVLVEVPDTGFRPVWDAFLMSRTTALMSRRLGVNRRKARPAAEAVISEMRKLARLRIGHY